MSMQRPDRDPATDAVIGLGTDLCAVARIARELTADRSDVLTAVFNDEELAHARAHRHPARTLAAIWAAKEAVIKALAPAGGQGTFWRDITITETGRGPAVRLHGRLADLAGAAGIRRVLVSTAHGRDYATACAIASG